jgi:hypothetical protein
VLGEYSAGGRTEAASAIAVLSFLIDGWKYATGTVELPW